MDSKTIFQKQLYKKMLIVTQNKRPQREVRLRSKMTSKQGHDSNGSYNIQTYMHTHCIQKG